MAVIEGVYIPDAVINLLKQLSAVEAGNNKIVHLDFGIPTFYGMHLVGSRKNEKAVAILEGGGGKDSILRKYFIHDPKTNTYKVKPNVVVPQEDIYRWYLAVYFIYYRSNGVFNLEKISLDTKEGQELARQLLFISYQGGSGGLKAAVKGLNLANPKEINYKTAKSIVDKNIEDYIVRVANRVKDEKYANALLGTLKSRYNIKYSGSYYGTSAGATSPSASVVSNYTSSLGSGQIPSDSISYQGFTVKLDKFLEEELKEISSHYYNFKFYNY